MREHFYEIARAAAGGSVDGDWEIPVCYLLTDGVLGTTLPRGVFYVRLVASSGSIHWRLSDGAGHDADMPLAWTLHRPNHNGGESRDATGSTCHDEKVTNGGLDLTIRLLDWPGNIKPTLQLRTKGVLLSEYTKPDQPLLSEVERVTSGISGFGDCSSSPDVDYLDAQRRHRLAVQWNGNAGRELCRLCDDLERGRGGAAILGVVATDSAFAEPRLPGGAYLLKLVVPGPNQFGTLGVSSG